jgi:hypothetical protein
MSLAPVELATDGGELGLEAHNRVSDQARRRRAAGNLAQLPCDGIEPVDLKVERLRPTYVGGRTSCSHSTSVPLARRALKRGEPYNRCGKPRNMSAAQAGCQSRAALPVCGHVHD